MKIDEIKELVQMLEQSTLTAIELHQGSDSIRLERNYTTVQSGATLDTTVQRASVIPQNQSGVTVEVTQPKGIPVICPLVGVFYSAPSPNDAPYVAVGSSVKKGDVLCIVEAMKLMNEITAEQDGVITEICVENGQIVEFGQPLFYFA